MEEFKNIKIALLGSGTVGTGVYKLIERQKDELPHKIGANLSVSKVLVRDKNKKREGINPEHLTDQWEDIITDDDIQIVVEVMGGIEPARTYITQALQAGKNVVTANKDLMAVHGGELLDIATENGCDLLFEASVAGGIPIIRPLKQCLAGNYISEVMGIVNGTTNFILTKMTHEGMEFDEALALATELGYAEADPTADIEGYDAGRKMAIMASITQALQAGKNVVTANKDLMAVHGGELLDIATENGCDLLFEASVAGGIPIIRPLKQCLAGNYISEVMGIVNGTTNFILTKMTHEGMEFDEALALATELGYAEADPTADIEGYDAGRKMAIMASIAFNSRVTFNDVYTEGITNITAKDIKYAEAMGCTIKLLGVAKNTDTGIEVRVHPMLIPSDHPLATVNDSFNAVFVHGDAVDDTMFYGRGAGELPTASAVMGDIIDVARNIQFYCNGRIHCTCYKNLPIKKITEIESKYFMRLLVDDKPGVLAQIASTLGKNNVSIAQVIQKNKIEDQAELVVITDLVLEQNFADALVEIKGMDHTREISTVIRVY